jgi:hypothetical protein
MAQNKDHARCNFLLDFPWEELGILRPECCVSSELKAIDRVRFDAHMPANRPFVNRKGDIDRRLMTWASDEAEKMMADQVQVRKKRRMDDLVAWSRQLV